MFGKYSPYKLQEKYAQCKKCKEERKTVRNDLVLQIVDRNCNKDTPNEDIE